MSTIQCRSLCLLLAALFFAGSRGAAQSTTAADQNFKTIPQQVKANAETKATNKANQVGNSAADKLDSGVNKAYRGLLNKFKKKPKPVPAPKDSTNVHPTDSLPGVPKTGFVPVRRRIDGMVVADKVRADMVGADMEVGLEFDDKMNVV
jgi:hypothetical protein